MDKYFKIIKERVISDGEKVRENEWKLESCSYSVVGTPDNILETIQVPGLVEVVAKTIGGNTHITILKGSRDSLKFLATSI